MQNLTKKNWIAFGVIVSMQILLLILRFNFINFLMAFFESLLQFVNISTVYLSTDSCVEAFFAFLLILNIIVIVFLIRYFLKEPLETYGFHFRKFHLQLIFGVFLAVVLVNLRSGYFPEALLSIRFAELFSVQNVFVFLFTFIYAAYEEVLVRGFLLTFFQNIFKRPMLGLFLSAIVFGIWHYPKLQLMGYVTYTFSVGLVLGYLRLKSPEKSTIFSLSLAHGLYNFLSAFLLSL